MEVSISQRVKIAIVVGITTILFAIIAFAMTGAGVATLIDFYLNSILVGDSQGFNAIEGSNITITAVENGSKIDYTFSVSGSGSGTPQNLFETIITPLGSSVVADDPNDTLTLSSSDSTVTVSGDNTDDSIDFTVNQALLDFYSTIQDEGGNLTQRNILNFTGGGITCVDDVVDSTDCDVPSNAITNSFETIDPPLGTNPSAGSPTDTLFVTSSDSSINISGNSTTSTLDFVSNVTDSNASTLCSGTSTYLDGEGNCDTGGLNIVIFKTTDEVVNNSSTFQLDDEITFTGGAGEVYGFTFTLIYKATSTADLKIRFDCDAVDTDLLWRPTGSLNSGLGCEDGRFINLPALGTDQADRLVQAVDGLIEFTNSDTLTLEWAQQVAEVSDATVSRGAHLILWRLNP